MRLQWDSNPWTQLLFLNYLILDIELTVDLLPARLQWDSNPWTQLRSFAGSRSTVSSIPKVGSSGKVCVYLVCVLFVCVCLCLFPCIDRLFLCISWFCTVVWLCLFICVACLGLSVFGSICVCIYVCALAHVCVCVCFRVRVCVCVRVRVRVLVRDWSVPTSWRIS